MPYAKFTIEAEVTAFVINGPDALKSNFPIREGEQLLVGIHVLDVVLLRHNNKKQVFIPAFRPMRHGKGTVFYLLPDDFYEMHPVPLGSISHFQQVYCKLLQRHLEDGKPESDARRMAHHGANRIVNDRVFG